jgi:hypothetical protein
MLAALRRGLEDKDAGKAARTAVAYVQLVYGRQLQQPKDEETSDPLDVASMTREERGGYPLGRLRVRWPLMQRTTRIRWAEPKQRPVGQAM